MRKITALIGLGILSLAASAQAVIVAGWNLHDTTTKTYPLAASNTDATVATTAMTYVGLVPFSDPRTIFQGYDPRTAIDLANDYLQFSVAMDPGMTLDPTALRLCSATLTSVEFDVRSSQDAYASSLGVIALTGQFANYRVDLSSMAPTSSVTFRLYGFNSSTGAIGGIANSGSYGNASGDWTGYNSSEIAFANFLAVSGTVPEPTLIGCGLASACGLLMRRRRTMA